ncbi:MAG: glycoside hydrolase [Gemmatimonadaceae bacterium]|nr:glycoside hydrolase [Gemmatimonadaceae bacterium]
MLLRSRMTYLLAPMVLLSACATGRDATGATSMGPLTELPVPAQAGSSTPFVTVRGDRELLLSWTQRRPDSTVAIQLAAWNGTTWDSTRTIAAARPFFVNWADFPAITALANGDLAAHWLERDGEGKYAYGVRVVRSADAGRTWSAPVVPHTDGLAAEHGFVSLWADGADGLGLVWLDGRKSAMPDSAKEMTIRTARLTASGAIEREALLDARSCDCCQTGTAAATSGRVIVYRDRSAEEIRDIAIVRETANGWTPSTKVHEDGWHYPGCPVNGPQVAAVGDTVYVAWFTGARDTNRVHIARSTDGGATFGAPLRVDEGTPLGRVSLVLDAKGHPVIAWLEQRTNQVAEVLARRIRPEGTQLTARETHVLAQTSGARPSGFPRLARVADTLYATWTTTTPSLAVHVGRLTLY